MAGGHCPRAEFVLRCTVAACDLSIVIAASDREMFRLLKEKSSSYKKSQPGRGISSWDLISAALSLCSLFISSEVSFHARKMSS